MCSLFFKRVIVATKSIFEWKSSPRLVNCAGLNRISVVKCTASCRNSITENFAIKECNLTVDVNCYATTFCWKIGQLTLFATFFNQQDIYFTFAAGFWPRIYTMTASIRILTKWSAAMTLMYLTYWKLKSDRMWTTSEQSGRKAAAVGSTCPTFGFLWSLGYKQSNLKGLYPTGLISTLTENHNIL